MRHLKGKLPLRERNPNLGLPDSSPVSSKRKVDKVEKVSFPLVIYFN